MADLVKTLDSALNAITVLNQLLPKHPDMADRLGQAHAIYVLDKPGGEPQFGFSKFVGYESLTAEASLKNYKRLDGRNTDWALKKWFEELTYGSPAYEEYFTKVSAWMSRYGKRPREGDYQKLRILIVRPEFRDPPKSDATNDKLLQLLIAVADLLPIRQRHALRAAL